MRSPRLVEALAVAVELAAATEDRTRQEQRALLTAAKWLDGKRNVLSEVAGTNPIRLGHQPVACPLPAPHDKKKCPCKGRGLVPGLGPSLLVQLVEGSWVPQEEWDKEDAA